MSVKSALIKKLSQQLANMPEKDIILGIKQLLTLMSQTLINGERIEIRNFGTFSLHYHPARNAHNPKTGIKLLTKPSYSVYFKPSKRLRQQINQKTANLA
jgi:integration host factor subunit beta